MGDFNAHIYLFEKDVRDRLLFDTAFANILNILNYPPCPKTFKNRKYVGLTDFIICSQFIFFKLLGLNCSSWFSVWWRRATEITLSQKISDLPIRRFKTKNVPTYKFITSVKSQCIKDYINTYIFGIWYNVHNILNIIHSNTKTFFKQKSPFQKVKINW